MSDQSSQTAEPLSVYTLISVSVEQLASVAWQKMGLQSDPLTGKIEKDLSQARVAVDAVADLVRHLEPVLDEDDRRSVQNMLRDLRVNFVQHSKE